MVLELRGVGTTLSIEPDGGLTVTRDGKPVLSLSNAFVDVYGATIRTTSLAQHRIEGQTLHATFETEAKAWRISLEAQAEHDGFHLVWSATAQAPSISLTARLEVGGPWYGMGERVIQGWPLEQFSVISQPLAPQDNVRDGTLNICTPLWLNAAGIGLLVDQDTGALDARLNVDGDGRLRLVQWARQPLPDNLDDIVPPVPPRLSLRILVGDHIPAAHRLALAYLGRPTTAPPLSLMVRPIWTSWARYKMHITQDQVLQFADEIRAHNYPYSVFEIDDRWQTDYGDLQFDRVKFPDPTSMVEQLHARGFRVTLWVMPFFNTSSATYREATARGFLLRHRGTSEPVVTRWWQGYGGLLDVSNGEALAWWLRGLQRLQKEHGIDGFKFDAGEGTFVPPDGVGAGDITVTNYADQYVAFVAQHFQWTEVRSGWRSQRHGILFREWDKWSRWGQDNGLHAVLTQALAMGLIGYPFVLPDMIGGNAYAGEDPNAELMIRWTQLTALLPSMQFSLAPWDYDVETTEICRRYAQLHETLTPQLSQAIAETLSDGTPLVRPLFWHAPDDAQTYSIDDQFMLGERLLVAPVVKAGQRERCVYLPSGQWRDYWTGQPYTGPTTLDAYPAPLDTLPLFERIE
ncbi:MAG: glycoside hydrolase [Anaerolineae bacterium]|nr:glycoside hydrolase [Anaerolineae bacterium]